VAARVTYSTVFEPQDHNPLIYEIYQGDYSNFRMRMRDLFQRISDVTSGIEIGDLIQEPLQAIYWRCTLPALSACSLSAHAHCSSGLERSRVVKRAPTLALSMVWEGSNRGIFVVSTSCTRLRRSRPFSSAATLC
jgi:hypothetical protein